jgi:Ca-activated chloride channel family protein
MKHFWALLVGWLVMVAPASGAGYVVLHEPGLWPGPGQPHILPLPRPPVPPPRPAWLPIVMESTRTEARIRDQVAEVTVEEVIYNPNNRALEGTFIFPLPKGAQISRFNMDINGQKTAGELLPADKARRLYEDIVRNLRDPALLEYVGRDLYQVRIFPLEPNARKKLRLTYQHLLRSDGGLVQFALPLATEKNTRKGPASFALDIDLVVTRPLKSIYSPTHKIEVKRQGDKQARIAWESGSNPSAEREFQLFFSREEGPLGVELLTWKEGAEDGYFLLLATPDTRVDPDKIQPKDVTFVLDTSGSMAGPKLDQAKKALLFCLENLNPRDRFDIIRFSTEIEPLFGKLTDISADSREQGRKFVSRLQPLGGTAIDDALQRALQSRPAGGQRPYVVVFLTDGLPTVGNTVEDQIVSRLTQANSGNTRVFCFGIGTDVNTHLLDRVTEETRAFSQYVLPEEDIEIKVSNFFTKVKDPVLTSPAVAFPEAVHVTRMHPGRLPDLFRGEQLMVLGRYQGQGEGKVRLSGEVGGQTRQFDFEVRFPAAAAEHEFIPRLWAVRRVGFLLDEIRLRGESAELKEEVTALARKYGVVTPYTAYLILEDERRQNVVTATRSLLPSSAAAQPRRDLDRMYESARKSRSGADAVAGALSVQSLSRAEAPAAAIRQSAMPTPPPRGASGPVVTTSPAAVVDTPVRYAGGRAFYFTGDFWTDAAAQQVTADKTVRVVFDSPEYYQLLRDHPECAPWLGLGSRVRFMLARVRYEIVER